MRNLKFHVRSYHDKQRLECSYSGCSQTFVNKSKLVQHSKLHDPNKPPPKKMPKKGHRKKSMAERLANIQTHMIEATDSGREDQPFTDGVLNDDQPITDIVTNNDHPIKDTPVKDNLPIMDSVVEDCQPIVTAGVEDKQPMVDVVAEQGHPITKFVAKNIQPIQVVENNQPCTDNGLLIKSVLHSERIDLEMERNDLELERNDLELERNDLELERNDLDLAINTNKKIPANINLCENQSINKTNGFNDVIKSDKLKVSHLGKKEDRTDNQENSGFKTDFTNVRLGDIGKEKLISSSTMSEKVAKNNSIYGEILQQDQTKDESGHINDSSKYFRLKTMDNGDSSVQYSICGDTDIDRVGEIGQMFSRNRKYRNYEMDGSEAETIVDLWLECVSESQTQSTQTNTTDS